MKTFFKYFKRFSYVFWMLIAAFLCFNCAFYSIIFIIMCAEGTYYHEPLNCGFELPHYIIFILISIPLFIFIIYKFIKRIIHWFKGNKVNNIKLDYEKEPSI